MVVRVGIIGCGAIAAFAHVPALMQRKSSGVEIAALCDRDLTRAELVKNRYGLRARCSTDAFSIIHDPSIDAVIVATWPNGHVPLAIEAIDSGRHVLLQKPLTIYLPEIDDIVAAAEATELNVMALPIVATVPSLSALKDVVESGSLGTIHLTRLRISISGPSSHYQDVRRFFGEDHTRVAPIFAREYASGGGCLSDMGPYALALMQYLHGQAELVSVVRNKKDFETVALLNLRLPEDCLHSPSGLCAIEVGWSQYSAMEVCSVFGSDGAATVTTDGKLYQWPAVVADDLEQPSQAGAGVLPTSPVSGQDEWLDAILHDRKAAFVDSVRQAAWTAKLIIDAYGMS